MNVHAHKTPPAELLARFAAIVGAKYAITDPVAQESYLVEMRDLYHGRTPMVLRPGSVAEVSAILALANETGTPVVPQGGNTGLVGGQIPHHGEIVVFATRLDRIREIDPVSNTITCEAGVTLGRARDAAARSIGSIPCFSLRRERAPSAATFRPMPAGRPPSPMASPAPRRSVSKWCLPMGGCSTTSTSSRRTTPATT